MSRYRLLLRLYPASFRAEYAEEMKAVFARQRREASGPLGGAAFWIGAVFETIWNAAAAHWNILRQDLRYAARALARAPGIGATAIAVIALGVGANTAASSVTDFALIRLCVFHSRKGS